MRTREAVAVVAHTTSQATLATALVRAAEAAGIALELRTLTEFAAEVTVRQEPGRPVAVSPDRPLLWLAVGDPPAEDADERFAQAESYAAARSFALLTASPVLNRPTAFGSLGALPVNPVAALRGARRPAGDQVRTEHFGTGRQDVPAVSEVLDYSTGRRSRGPTGDIGPFRWRAATGSRTAWVTVAGKRTLGPAVDGLHEASRSVAASYGLGLAHVWWSCPPDAPPALSRVDAYAWDLSLGIRVHDVAAGLVAWCEEPS